MVFKDSVEVPENHELTWVTSEPVRTALKSLLRLIQRHLEHCGALLPENPSDVCIQLFVFIPISFVAVDANSSIPRAESAPLPCCTWASP